MKLDITQTSQTSMDTKVNDFSIDQENIEDASSQKETFYMNENWNTQLGYFKHIPELNRAITALAIWTAGKGYTTDTATEVMLDNIIGWGEDTFTSIMINMLKVKKFGRDAYAEIIRNEKSGTLLNLKVLNTGKMRHVVNSGGKIIRYEYLQANGTYKKFQPNQIFHLCNDRIANEIHGTSIAEVVKWVIEARKEAMEDWRRISHRATIRVMYIDEDDTSRVSNLKKDYAEAIDKGELLLIPGKPGENVFQELNLPPVQAFLEWIRYLENFFYQAVGVPRVIATSEDYTESGSKVGFLTFEPVYTNVISCLEDTTKQGVTYLGLHGGYYEIPEAVSISYFTEKIPYYYLNSKIHVPSVGRIEGEIGRAHV